MQTFLPYANFQKSVECLDYRRLGKQRVECKQILNALLNGNSGWKNHPAVKMWKGFEDALKVYANKCITEWVRRGYKNTMKPYLDVHGKDIQMPPWFGNEKFHASHRSNLLRKFPAHYEKFEWEESDRLPYIWPTKDL